MSSQPMIASCPGTRTPLLRQAASAPIAIRSFAQTRAVNAKSLLLRNCSIASYALRYVPPPLMT